MAKKIKLGIAKGRAFAADSGVINDSIGRVSYAYKANAKIQLENLTNNQNNSLKTPANQTLVKIDANTNSVDCFYKLLSRESVYKETKKDAVITVTEPTINVYLIRLTENIYTLEIRNNDAWILTGLDSAPLDIFTSIAISTNEVTSIKTKVTDNNFIGSSNNWQFGTPVDIKNPGERKYYKSRLSISGSKNGISGIVKAVVDTGIDVYSLDKCNWISAAYANGALTKITGTKWDNQIVPNPIDNNPFSAYWHNGSNTGLKDRLNTIISQADNLPSTNDNKGYRLLNTAIRDYIYQGNIEKVTFEMAFRLPFYIENIKEVPYTTVNGRFNNPYYTKFDEWFGYANGVRTLAGKTILNEVGKPATDYNSSYHDYNLVFQDLVGIVPQERKNYFVTNLVPAYIAKNFEYENPNYVPIAHLPWPANSIVKKGNSRNLADLVSISVISAIVKTGLENGTIIYAKIEDGIYNGEELVNCYVSKNKKDNKYYVNKYSWNEKPDKPNSSGLTFGFGYDIGANSGLQAFKDYTGFNVPETGVIHDAVNDALGKKKINAMHNYFKYYDSVWKSLKIPYGRAVSKTIPTMKNSYLKPAINFMAKRQIINGVKTNTLYLRIYQPTFGYFFEENSPQYLNEIEKTFLLSQCYNTGIGSLDPHGKKAFLSKRAKRAIHSFNTHDLRYLRYTVSLSGIAHRDKIMILLNKILVYNYFKNKV